jgi:NAD(P)-dependent dehydrogenase (short-subunit alcohol dehydrogenase family)
MSKIHHAAFDAGLIGIDPDLNIHLSPILLEMQDGPLLEHALSDRAHIFERGEQSRQQLKAQTRAASKASSREIFPSPILAAIAATAAAISSGLAISGKLGTPDEVTKIIYVMCTETSSYVNGAEVHINGGQHV